MFTDPVLPGFRPDPTICRVGADYYLVTSSFEWFPGLPVFHSRDLVRWRPLGHALDRPSQLNLDGCGPSRGLFAPTLRHHDGLFHLVCTLMDGPGHFVVTATDPAGPWSEPHWLAGDGFDPSLFFDDDGRAWFTATRGEIHTEIWIREYDPAARCLTGPEHVLWTGSGPGAVWSEAPHLYKIDGTYLLLTAEGGTERNHSVVAARADHVTGPYTGAPHNPVLPPATGPVTCTGHADLVQTPTGDWRAVLLGVRPGGAMGRETFLAEVTWTGEGWPVFSAAPYRPTRAPIRDDFHVFSPAWSTLRTPREDFWTVGDGLDLRLRPERLGERVSPSLLARTQEHPDCDVTTELHFDPAEPHEHAGLAVVLDDDAHLLLVRERDGVRLLRGDVLLAEAAVPSGPVRLGVAVRGHTHTYRYAAAGDGWRDLAEVDASFLVPLFTGVHFGLYASSNGHPSAAGARFAWFRCRPA